MHLKEQRTMIILVGDITVHYVLQADEQPKCLCSWSHEGVYFMYTSTYLGCAKNRSSHRICSVKKGVLRNFAKFTRKHLYQSLFFNKVIGLRLVTLLKKKLWRRCFRMNFSEFLRTPFLQNTSRQLLLKIFFKLFKMSNFRKLYWGYQYFQVVSKFPELPTWSQCVI